MVYMGGGEFYSQWMSKGPLCFLQSMLVISGMYYAGYGLCVKTIDELCVL